MDDFGKSSITQDHLERIERLTTRPVHPFLRRGLFITHKDLDLLLDEYEKGEPFYIYTGIGPSSPRLHLGHLIPFILTQYLQEAFNVHVVIQITDDEKLLFRRCTLQEIQHNMAENIKDIVALGFDPAKTFIFNNIDHMGQLYPNVLKIQSRLTNSQVKAVFGIKPSDNIGQTSFCAIQAAPALHDTFPHLGPHPLRCLVPQGQDQDPYFRLCRDVCPKLGYPKPALIHSTFVCALSGTNNKMSSSNPKSAIFLDDTPKKVKKKINKSFSGGLVDQKDQMLRGADLSKDVAYQLIRYFEEDDEVVQYYANQYGSDGTLNDKPKLLSGEVKKKAIELVNDLLQHHQQSRAQITEEELENFRHATY
jgi:tryptophanyl-tRNA synthetase